MLSLQLSQLRSGVSVIMTVKNDPAGCAQTLESLTAQARMPDEVIVVDGGSTDDTVSTIKTFESRLPHLRVLQSSGANIATGREIATKNARGPVIASIDAGCRADADWLKNLTDPFELDPQTEVVAGMYRIDPTSLFECVVGMATMRGQLEPVDPKTFNPSGRSMAYTKDVWRRAGGWPTWLDYSEDTYFDHCLRRVASGWQFAPMAIVHWRPRTGFRPVIRQFFCYGTGRGHTQIGAADFRYNLRNLALMLVSLCTTLITPWGWALVASAILYFYVWTFHRKAAAIVRRTGRLTAYPLTLAIMWVVLFANLAGYLVGSWEEIRGRHFFLQRLDWYLAA